MNNMAYHVRLRDDGSNPPERYTVETSFLSMNEIFWFEGPIGMPDHFIVKQKGAQIAGEGHNIDVVHSRGEASQSAYKSALSYVGELKKIVHHFEFEDKTQRAKEGQLAETTQTSP